MIITEKFKSEETNGSMEERVRRPTVQITTTDGSARVSTGGFKIRVQCTSVTTRSS
jgi:hypothetical protein